MFSYFARGSFRIGTIAALLAACLAVFAPKASARQALSDWHDEVRRDAQSQRWTDALQVINGVVASDPHDDDARAWRGRVLLWSGDTNAAKTEFLALTVSSPKDPDIWEGLASVYERVNDWTDALHALDRALGLDPGRADLHAERGRVLRALNQQPQAREEFLRVLAIDPANAEGRAGLASLEIPPNRELRVGTDNDLLNYTSAYESEWMSLTSAWSSRWTTNIAGDFFQRGGLDAGKFLGSLTAKSSHWGALTAGGATGHDNGIIPRSEAFFGLDRGWRISEGRPLRGIEATYDQHWYWYSTARIFTVAGGALVYLPRDWMWSINATGARSSFPELPVSWKPSGMSRLNFPLSHWSDRNLTGNVFFAVGSEDFALVDQIGSFSAQTYGGGFKFQLNARQDVTGYGSFQQRTQDHTDTAFGFSYGIHF
jgi:tetratricopeptide (TPR) repeat protein